MINSVWKYQGQQMNNFPQCRHASFLPSFCVSEIFEAKFRKISEIGYFVRAELGI
jgi:hypothetical protein